MNQKTVSLERLQEQIRKIPLAGRLERVLDIVSEMCKEGRPPKMSIPVQAKDEDIFITTTIQDVMSILADLHAKDKTCRFQGALPEDIGCLACIAQSRLADALPHEIESIIELS